MTRFREFSYLTNYDLEACAIRGDGNCLFNALSDQIYGHQGGHAEIRQGVIQYMRENPNQFKYFVSVGGVQRRNPKRKNAGSLSSNVAFTEATEAEIDAAYEAHLTQMAQGGTWGDNHEIQAFIRAYNTNVRIYQENGTIDMKVPEDDVVRPMAHIAYHKWEHYSSVRNTYGPMTGPPHVKDHGPIMLNANGEINADPLMVKQVIDFLPHIIDEDAIIKALLQTKGNINDAVSKLLDADYISSQSTTPATISSPGSVSIERDSETEDDDISPPSKRQNRSVTAETTTEQENDVLHARTDYKDAKASHKKGNLLIEKDYTKSVTHLDANDASDAASDTTGTEDDNEFDSLDSSTSVSNSIATGDSKEINDDKPGSLTPATKAEVKPTISNSDEVDSDSPNPPADVTETEAKPADSDSEEETSEIVEFAPDEESIASASDGEADDEFRLDAEDDDDSDSMPDTLASTSKGSAPYSERKNIPHPNRVQKHTHKDSKRSKARRKVLEAAIRNIIDHPQTPPPV